MALTPAEWQARRRQKLKDGGQYGEFKRKNAEQKRKSRNKRKEEEEKLSVSTQKKIEKERREQTKKRVARCRALKKQRLSHDQESQQSPAFKSAQALGKAVTRAKHALTRKLPQTPKRRKAVCHRLFKQLTGDSDPVPLSPSMSKVTSALSKETIALIQRFYEREDISRQAPGRKDFVTVRNEDGTKLKIQARHLTFSVMEVFALFSEEYPEVKIGKSKFADLRPSHVLLSNKLPHNVCLCKYHENFISAINAMHNKCPNLPNYDYDIPEKLLCTPATRECWFNQCENCKDGKIFKAMSEMDVFEEVSWFVWKNDSDGKLGKMVEEGTTDDLQEYICSILPQFMTHCYVKRQQGFSYQKEREQIESSDKKALLQVDFSENYTCMYQDEIQSAHWHQHQVSLFTAALWHSSMLHSIVVASDNLVHSKDTLLAYIDMILETIPASIETVSIWSDGPASQFKNRFVAAALTSLQKKHDVIIHWNFFATSHGKGPVDGIGGAVKRQVWNVVRSRKQVVNSASSFVDVSKNMPKVSVLEMSASNIDERNEALKLKEVFADAPTIKGIAQFHHFRAIEGKVATFILTNDAASEVIEAPAELTEVPDVVMEVPHEFMEATTEALEEPIKTDDWWIVEYDGKLFPGIVKRIRCNYFEVTVMVPVGSFWKWPPKEDKIFYHREQLKKKVQPPVMINARDHWQFSDI